MLIDIASFLLVLCTSTTAQTAADRPADAGVQELAKPNIIYILADDLGYGDLGVQGSDFIKTPVLDALAEAGRRLTNSSSSAANCSPSRISILTGEYPFALNFQGASHVTSRRGVPDDLFTVAELLQEAGYTTGHVGKWHIGEDLGPDTQEFLPPGVGFDSSARLFIPTVQTHWEPLMIVDEQSQVQESGHSTDVLTQYAIDFLDEQQGSPNPFFLNLWYFAPHLPAQVPAQWLDLYPESDPEDPWTIYAAMVSHMDAGIGQVLAKLAEIGQADRTLVMFTSDNGGAGNIGLHPDGNGPFAGFKGDYLEGGVRVPFIARWPGVIPANSEDDSIVMGFDFLPTVAELLESPAGSELHGRSMLQALVGNGTGPRTEPLVWTRKAAGMPIEPANGIKSVFGVRRDRTSLGGKHLKFYYDAAQKIRLYDLTEDPGEQTNIALRNQEQVVQLWNTYWIARRQETELEWEAMPFGDVIPTEIGWEFFGGTVAIASDAPFDFHDGHFTVKARFRLNHTETSQTLIRKVGSYELMVRAGGQLQLVINADDGQTHAITSETPVVAGQVYRVAFSFSRWTSILSGNTAHLYLDEVELGQAEISAVSANRNPVLIGNNGFPVVGTRPTNGVIANVGFFVQALTPEEIGNTLPPAPGS